MCGEEVSLGGDQACAIGELQLDEDCEELEHWECSGITERESVLRTPHRRYVPGLESSAAVTCSTGTGAWPTDSMAKNSNPVPEPAGDFLCSIRYGQSEPSEKV